MRLLNFVTFFSVMLMSSISVVAQASPPSVNESTQITLPYEIVITPTITKGRLRDLQVEIEDDFFAKFNELNIDDDYDVFCYEFIPTGSHIRQRVCDPAFLITARNENASEFSASFGACATCRNSSAIVLSQHALRIQLGAYFEILQEKMEDFIGTDKEFKSIGDALADVKSRLEYFDKD